MFIDLIVLINFWEEGCVSIFPLFFFNLKYNKMNKKIIILDYKSGQVFVVNDEECFYDEGGGFIVDFLLEVLYDEFDLNLSEDSIHWMLSDDAVINLL